MATVPRLLTYEDWLRMPPVEDSRDEVVNGELRFTPPTHYPHAEIIQRLIELLIPQVDRKQVAILGSNFGLMIRREPLTCRSPDLALFRRETMVIRDGLYWSAPDLVVEIISPSETRRRKEEKLTGYASIGIPEAWLISPEAQSVEVRLLSEGQLKTTAILVSGVLQPTRFPQISLLSSEIRPPDLS